MRGRVLRFKSRDGRPLGYIGLLVVGLGLTVSCALVGQAGESRVMGWTERVQVYPGGLTLEAKLDTGARTSSINVQSYEKIERGGKTWLRFSVSDRNGKSTVLERPVVRYARIRRSESRTTERPVVMLGLCIGGSYREVEVNLADRSHLNYPLLVGRTTMKGNIVVDPARKFTAPPNCPGR
jgi:hypothetical protein